MKTLLSICAAVLIFSACGNGSNQDRGDETPASTPSAPPADSSSRDTMVLPTGVSGGHTVSTDTTQH